MPEYISITLDGIDVVLERFGSDATEYIDRARVYEGTFRIDGKRMQRVAGSESRQRQATLDLCEPSQRPWILCHDPRILPHIHFDDGTMKYVKVEGDEGELLDEHHYTMPISERDAPVHRPL